MEVLERDAYLEALTGCLEAARHGKGRLVLVAGEAGIGKTALVEHFCGRLRGARVLRGACDPLVTPRPLGPVLDLTEPLRTAAADEAVEPSRDALFRLVLDELASRSWTTVALIEDAHWADEATGDLIRFVGRRLRELRGMILVTYRDDELGPSHPLRTVLGDLATAPGVVRMELAGLSREAVAALSAAAGAVGVDVDDLHRRTAGNPFYVTEVLAAGGRIVPGNVVDAVLARAARLPAAARRVIDAAAIVPTRVESSLLRDLASASDSELDDCAASGILRNDAPGTLAFRHELARQAVEQTLLPARRTSLHAAAARLLLKRYGADVDSARVAHHAEQAGDGALAREHATRAARRSAELGAHREAADQYERALRHAEGRSDEELATLLEAYVAEAGATDRTAAALVAASQAVALRRALGDARALGTALHIEAGRLWSSGHSADAGVVGREAVELLEALNPGPELADAYAFMATHAMLARDHPGALCWGDKAIALAERIGHVAALARALNSVGGSKLVNGIAGGLEDLRRSIAVASEAGMDGAVARNWSNLGSGTGEVRDYATAEPALRETIRFSAERDLDANVHYTTAWLSRVRFERGDWSEAEQLAESLPLDRPDVTPITKIVALAVLGRLRARRGDRDPRSALDQAWALASQTGDLQRLWPVAAARAEAAWLAGGTESVGPLIDDVFALARQLGHGWAIGELGLWRRRSGRSDPLPVHAAEPYALHVAGRLDEAAAAWERLGCPYEAADALSDSDHPADLRRALGILDQLDAAAAAARVRRRLRELGERDIPRGPRPATAAHPAGLTPRQAEVLDLLAEGLSDGEIAERLFISPKTAGHHVSAILAKLGAASRGEAVHRARAVGGPPGDGGREPPT